MEYAQLHLLVAETDDAQRRHVVEALGQLGITRITEAPDGPTALRCIEDTLSPTVDVAVIDLDLPGIDGIELIRRVGANRACQTQAIVTGNQNGALMFSVETMAQAYGLNLLGSIAKPVTGAKLQTLLKLYEAPAAKAQRSQGPTFSFAEIGVALQARQFEPFFQPKIELETGQVKGLETFARWRHPDHGVLGPGAFIDALEQNKRVDFLDWTMIERSVAGARWLHDQGVPLTISINLAPQTLAHPAFMQQMAACMQRHRMMPDYITFEMPESSVLSNEPSFLERLVRLRMLGYGLAIDDYGTGRSNLQLLARIPFTELKIDRSFVDGASHRRPLATVLKTCLNLARSLERHSTAVGVETKEDWDFLQGVGCTYAQGYHIAKPMEVSELPAWLDDWRHFF